MPHYIINCKCVYKMNANKMDIEHPNSFFKKRLSNKNISYKKHLNALGYFIFIKFVSNL